MKKAKPKTNRNQAHTPKSPKGLGDYYGTGVRQPIGRVRFSSMDMEPVSPKTLGKPPKALA